MCILNFVIYLISYRVFGGVWELRLNQAKSRGKLDHEKIREFLSSEYFELSRYLCTWTRSTGGRGLGVILWMEPFLYNDPRCYSVQKLAERVQRLCFQVFSFHGFGADDSAFGLVRQTPNWRNLRKLLHKDDVGVRRVQRREHLNVLRQVYNELRRSSVLRPETRSDLVFKGLRFAVNNRTDEGLGKLYAYIIDHEPESLTLIASMDDICKTTGLAKPTIRKAFDLKPSWLDIEKIWGKG